MSKTQSTDDEEFNSEELDSIQENQNKVGSASSNPSTSSPADKLREEAAESSDFEEKEDEESPV